MGLVDLVPLPIRFGIAVVACCASFVAGWQVHGWRDSAGQLKAVQETRTAEHQAQERTDTVAAAIETDRAAQAPRDREIIKEVIRYVEVTPAADRCNLPGTWRLRHDAAATGTPTDPASVLAGAAGAVTDAAALEVVADNYQQCREWRRQVVGWQAWWGSVLGGEQTVDGRP